MVEKILTSIGDNVLIETDSPSKFSLEYITKRRYQIFYKKNNIGFIFNIIGRVDKPYLVGKITSKNLNLTGKIIEIILTNYTKKRDYAKKNKKKY